MAEKLTPQQAQAVNNRGGKLLVSAAAGSGKTKVLVDRLLKYLMDENDPANLDDFLMITYTKAAASELRGKIAAKLTERIAAEPENRHLQKQMQRLYLTHISTVHGFCSNILREYAYRLDLSADFRVADETECAELREQVLKDLLDRAYETLGEDEAFCAFVDSQGVGRNDAQVPEIIQKVYDAARCHLNPEGWLDECLQNAAPEGKTDASETVWGKFLMDNFFDYLDAQLAAMHHVRDRAAQYKEFEKPVANLDNTIAQLEYMRASNSWDELLSRRNIEYGRLVISKKVPDLELGEEIKAVRSACKDGINRKLRNFTDSSAQILTDLQASALAAQGLVQLVRQFGADFQRAKQVRRVLDFGDLEHKTLDLLLGANRSGLTAAAREIGQRFREIMVDEYQDSNGVQDAIFSALTQQKQNCFMVGDVKQSIYQFRLADPGIFLEKYNTYATADTAAEGEGRKVLLSHNFRSGIEVIEGINDVFSACMSPKVGGLYYGEAEALREGVPHQPLPDAAVELLVLETDGDSYAEEAALTAGRIQEMLSTGTLVRDGDGFRPVKAEDIVILLRSPGSVGQEFQKALEHVGIRCAIDGGMDLLQTPEISTLQAILLTIANPRQDIPLLSALASPVFGFTADDLAGLRSGHRKGCIYEAMLESESEKVRSFLTMLEDLRRQVRRCTLTELMERIYNLTRLDSIYGAMPGGKAKKLNLQMFYQLASDYEKTGLRSLDQFLEHLAALSVSGLKAAGSSTAGCVTIMSIHKSKGLEFPVVFLCGLARRFNQESLREQVLCDRNLGLGLAVVDNQKRIRYGSLSKKAIAVSMNAESVSEEMRVLYVAMTRARDRLVMTYAKGSLATTLQNIALRLGADGGSLLCQEASCPGDWVLAAAIQRTEAGELHALGGRPAETKIHTFPWKICVGIRAEAEEAAQAEEAEETKAVFSPAELERALNFQYPHQAAVSAPSKQTATGRKGRSRDEEAQENTAEPKEIHRQWRRPSFRETVRDGRVYGNAVHGAMQFIRYENCGSVEGIRQELARMVQEGLLTEEQGKLVEPQKIAAFFQTELGQKLVAGTSCVREFKFSILDDGRKYGEGLEGEQVLLQGVVDCALLESDGITVLDFKTDRVSEETLPAAVERYRIQVETYADALKRIYEQKVKEKVLYFFHLDRTIRLEDEQ